VRNNKGLGKKDRGDKSETEKEKGGEDPHAANTQYFTPSLSTTYYSATGASRTTLWALKADDEEKLDRRSDPQCTSHVLLHMVCHKRE